MAQKEPGEKPTIVLKRSNIKQQLMHVWICPECGYVVAEFSPAKALSAAKLHLERKHHYNVLVEE